MSDVTNAGQNDKAAKIRRRPKAGSVLTPCFAASRQAHNGIGAQAQPSGSGLLQRQCGCGKHTIAGGVCEECKKKQATGSGPAPDDLSQLLAVGQPAIRRVPLMAQRENGDNGGAFQAAPHVEAGISRMQNSGQPLPAEEQDFFAERLGYDFSQVRVHTNANAIQTSREIQAKAFTVGNNIAFNEGTYQPGTDSGRRLLAHELTHVVQQTGAQPAVQARHSADAAPNGQALIQRGLVDDVTDWAGSAVDAASEFAQDVIEWIDLLGPKQDLMAHMVDANWIIDRVTNVENQNEANPKHDLGLTLKLYSIGVQVGSEGMAFVLRIQNCNDLDELNTLREEFDSWKSERETSLQTELDDQVEEYREVERSWLETFAGSTVTEDPVHPNQSSQDVALTLNGGVPQATVVVETRINSNFQLTAQAQQDNDGDGNPDVPAWTDEERTHFMDRFQQQLDELWTTGAGATAPFRCSAPPDYLLSGESPKWSEITANMEARVTADATNPHFQINVFKEATGESNRAGVNDGTANFYMKNADAGYMAASGPDANRRSGDQFTLAHEWYHMIGNADEYAESSAAQSADTSNPADVQARWGTCQQHFQDIIDDSSSTPAQVQQAQADLQAVQNPWTDMDPATPGFQSGIYPLSGRSDIPDECFAVRGAWRPGEAGYQQLRPGTTSQRGGTTISDSAEDAARLSDRGNQVRPYMREGIVEALQAMLQGKFDPEVNFDHNFQDMTPEEVAETVQVRIQNALHDISDLGASSAPAGEAAPGADHDHDH